MVVPFSVFIKKEQCSAIFCGLKVHQRLQPIKDFQHNMGTASCCNKVSTNHMTNLKKISPRVTHEGGAGRQSTAKNDNDIENARDMVLSDERMLMTWQINANYSRF
jgi:hypothetical protein